MARLSSSIGAIKDHYPIVVIGSGYGGAIAASRMARAGQQVCVLERGKEFQPGEYPNSLTSAMSEMQTDSPIGHHGSDSGLFDARINEDINVFVGCGLGGTSLINASVTIRADSRVFDDRIWPPEIRNDFQNQLADGYRRAEEMLKPLPYPANFPPLAKMEALEKSAKYLNQEFYRALIHVTFADGLNHVGVEQRACNLCGDCVSGCNYSAKNTVLMNYLPDAKNHGAEIFTQVSVRRLERVGNRWLVHYQILGSGREEFEAPTLFLSADVVILAAGTLGTTEILLRSKEGGLPLSDQLGQRFSGNGDVLGFGYNADQEINAVGTGLPSEGESEAVGPTITGVIDARKQRELNQGMLIEEGAIPSAVSSLIPAALAAAAKLVGEDTDSGIRDFLAETQRELASLAQGPYHGATRNTQTYLVMGHDDAAGSMYLEDDRLRIRWPDVGSQPIFVDINERLKQSTSALGGTYVKNPAWTSLAGQSLVTVHPIGGCVMATDAQGGVVNHKGQVFSGASRISVHEGLYVADGSVIPRSLGANPLLTISALAERTCAILARDKRWQIDYTLPSQSGELVDTANVGIQFTEKMGGYFSIGDYDDFERAKEQGQQDDSEFTFTLTILSDDVGAFLTHPDHQAKMIGSVLASALSPEPMTATGGKFNLLIQNPGQADTRYMRYSMKMTSRDAKVYYFTGFKTIHDGPGFDIWSDTTTLFITVHDGDSQDSPVLGQGILKIDPLDFARQITTMRPINAQDDKEGLESVTRFGQFFAGGLWDTYKPG